MLSSIFVAASQHYACVCCRNSSFAKTVEEFSDAPTEVNSTFLEESQRKQFSKFMLRADYGSLALSTRDANSAHHVILVKYFPNAFYRDPTALHEILGHYRKYGKHPVIFVVSESPTGRAACQIYTENKSNLHVKRA